MQLPSLSQRDRQRLELLRCSLLHLRLSTLRTSPPKPSLLQPDSYQGKLTDKSNQTSIETCGFLLDHNKYRFKHFAALDLDTLQFHSYTLRDPRLLIW